MMTNHPTIMFSSPHPKDDDHERRMEALKANDLEAYQALLQQVRRSTLSPLSPMLCRLRPDGTSASPAHVAAGLHAQGESQTSV